MDTALRRLSGRGDTRPHPATGALVAVGAGRALGLGLIALPLGAALWRALQEAGGLALPAQAAALLAEPGVPRALALSVQTAVLATALSLALSLWLLSQWHDRPGWPRLPARLGPLLSVPHAAVAVGLAWLLAPAGWLARALAVPLGWTAPPDWQALQDASGFSLVLVLVLKETPFLLWSGAALLQRPDVAQALRLQMQQGRLLGARPARIWWLLLWPQWAPRLAAPVAAVLAYGLTVVDLALIIGPGSPPPMAVWVWQALQDADPARNAQGAAGAWLLTAVLAASLLMGALVLAGLRRAALAMAQRGHRPAAAGLAERRRPPAPAAPATPATTEAQPLGRPMAAVAAAHTASGAGADGAGRSARWAGRAGLAVYVAVALALVAGAWAGPWPFPALWPQAWHGAHWALAWASLGTLGTTAALAASVASLALALVVAWLASTPPTWDRATLGLLLLPLVLPALLWMVGLYPLALWARLDGQALGLAWVHLLMAVPYAWLGLQPGWRSLDPRLLTAARLLGHGPATVLWRVQLPLLRTPLAAAWAVAFAVSVAQYLPTQFIGAGRWPTLTTEAVTLAAGGQRGPASAFALWQALLPLAGFAAAAWLGRARRPVRRLAAEAADGAAPPQVSA